MLSTNDPDVPTTTVAVLATPELRAVNVSVWVCVPEPKSRVRPAPPLIKPVDVSVPPTDTLFVTLTAVPAAVKEVAPVNVLAPAPDCVYAPEALIAASVDVPVTPRVVPTVAAPPIAADPKLAALVTVRAVLAAEKVVAPVKVLAPEPLWV
jgi:hypothetical protein